MIHNRLRSLAAQKRERTLSWQPTKITRFVRGLPTSTRTAIVETDAGTGYLKGLGNPEGPHTLACELVGTRLAKWLGLSTLDYAIIEVDSVDEIPCFRPDGEQEGTVLPGPAFITRKESGDSWSGGERQLTRLCNPEDISRLVVLDTWLLNCDRHGPRENDPVATPRINRQNVFLSEEAPLGKLCLKAIDHTHCFTCGRALTTRVRDLTKIQDGRVFGRFPEFIPFLDRDVVRKAADRLRRTEHSEILRIMQDIPPEWEISSGVRDAWIELVSRRARFVADMIERKLWPQAALDYSEGEPTT